MPVPEHPIEGDFDTVLDLFDAVVDVAGDVEAFVDGGRRITFTEWAALGDAAADWLAREHGVGPGDVVGIHMQSSIDYAVAYQGVLRLGAIATGINPRLGPAELAHIVERCQPKVVVSEVPDLAPGDPQRRRARTTGRDPVAIVWTGGTTGFPKGAWFDHHCLRAMALGATPLSSVGDRRISPLPFAHVGYMTRVWDELEHVITTLIVPAPWTAEGALRLIDTEHATVCQGVPTQYRLMFDHPLFPSIDTSSLRLAGTGSARVPPELVAEITEKMGCAVVQRYAATECCLATGTVIGDDISVIATTVGRPNGDVELKIVDEAGATRPVGEVGAVCLRGRAQMRGYWRQPEATAEAIDAEGWLHTGDLGWIGDDGNLRLSGRTTELYIRGGYNVYPIEVENCLGGHPDLVSTAVVGAAVEDRLGEIGVLFAVPRAGAAVELADLRSWVKERLADYKAPDALVVVDQLPVTSIGKVDKKLLRSLADTEASGWHR